MQSFNILPTRFVLFPRLQRGSYEKKQFVCGFVCVKVKKTFSTKSKLERNCRKSDDHIILNAERMCISNGN